jgi:hypothetical protein
VPNLVSPQQTTCDIYRVGVVPPAAPSVAAVPCTLRAEFAVGSASASALAGQWTHIMEVLDTVDIRDHYTGSGAYGANFDTVYVPDQNGTAFRVRFVELVDRLRASQRKRVYLDRQAVTWPSNQL